MNRKQIGRYEMLVRVRDFGTERRELFPEASLAGQAFAKVDTVVKQLSDYAVAQMSARPRPRGSPSPRHALLMALQTISRTARAIKRADPTFDNKFRKPKPQPSQALLAVGRSFIREAEAVADVFLANEMPTTFIADLTKLVDALEHALQAREAQRIARTVARVHFKTTLDEGLGAVYQLDVQVANRLKDDPAALAVWDNARRIDYRTRPDSPEASPTPATPPTKDAPTPPVTPTSTVPGDKAA